MAGQLLVLRGQGGGVQETLRHFLGFGISAHQGGKAKRRQGGGLPLFELLRGKRRVVVPFQRFKQRMVGVKGLHPHFAGGAVPGVAARPACGLHQQAEQALGRAKVAGKQRAVGVDGGHQRDVAEIVALGNHLRADQHIDLAGMHAGQLRFERAFVPGGVGINAGNAHRAAVGSPDIHQQLGQMFFEPLGAASDRGDVEVAAARAGARHAFGEAAVVAAQRAVNLVEHAVGAAIGAVAFPVAVVAGQHRRITAPVQENHRLLATRHALANGQQQRRGDDAVFGLVVHVHAPDQRQGRIVTDSLVHVQALVAAGNRGLPAFE